MQNKVILSLIIFLSLLAGMIMPHGGIILVFFACSLAMTVLLGKYMALFFDDKITWLMPVENFLLKFTGVSNVNQNWKDYAKSLIFLNIACSILAMTILAFQNFLPLNPLHYPGMEPWQLFNTVCSFITNTNWQSYSGEQSLSNLSQMVITFMQVIGATSGIVVCIAFIRGLVNRPLGDFYKDFTRCLLYLMLPYMVIGSLFFISQGVPQTLHQQTIAHTIEGSVQKIALGPVASLLSIKQFGTNGGGFFNANSAHPFENPNAFTNFIEILMELSISMGLVYTFGAWLKDKKQAWMIWGAMMAMFLLFFAVGNAFEQQGNVLLSDGPLTSHVVSNASRSATTPEVNPIRKPLLATAGDFSLKGRGVNMGIDQVQSALQSGGNMEGKEIRFGILPSMLFTTATTGTSTGAINNMHDSLTPIGGLIPLWDMMLNIVFGGVGVGLMGFLLYGVIAVFLTGLMVGRTPEIFGKKIEKPEIVLASIAILLHPMLILFPTAIAVLGNFGLSSLNNAGPHGLSEILYAYTSAAANNGSAFAGLNANTPWYNISIGVVILLGRYISIIALLAISGSLLLKPKVEPGPGTLKTNTLLFTVVWIGTIIIVSALTFVPVLALGPVAEQLQMLSGKLF